MLLKNVFGRAGGDVQFVIFPGFFYIESRRNVMEKELFEMAKKRLKKTVQARHTQGKRPYDSDKRQQYYSFGIFVGDY
jgi:hypothetical protein